MAMSRRSSGSWAGWVAAALLALAAYTAETGGSSPDPAPVGASTVTSSTTTTVTSSTVAANRQP